MIKAIKKLLKPDKTLEKLKHENRSAQRRLETMSAELEAKIKTIEELNARLTALNDQLAEEIAEKEKAFARLRLIVDELSVKIYNINEEHSLTISEKDKMISQLRTDVDDLNGQLERLKRLHPSLTD